MTAQIYQLMPLPPRKSSDLTYEQYLDFLRTLEKLMKSTHTMGSIMQERKLTLPAIRIFSAIHLMADAHKLISREAIKAEQQ